MLTGPSRQASVSPWNRLQDLRTPHDAVPGLVVDTLSNEVQLLTLPGAVSPCQHGPGRLSEPVLP